MHKVHESTQQNVVPLAFPVLGKSITTTQEIGLPSQKPGLTEDQMQQRLLEEKQGLDALWEDRLRGERITIAQLLEQVQREKETYFQKAEREVVSLALKIAERILHHEAMMDPLLLAGAVRVALDGVKDGDVVVRVAEEDLPAWRERLKDCKVRVEKKAGMEAGACEVESELGTLQLDIRSQLQEVETSFRNLMLLKPA